MDESIASLELPAQAGDGHRWQLIARIPARPQASLLWLPAMGIPAKHYLPLAEALAARGIAVFVHEWRGIGSSNLRANRTSDWGYRQLLLHDLPASEAVIADHVGDLPRILGGHSLGSQLACCRLALSPSSAQRLWVVAGNSPYWRAYPRSIRFVLLLMYRFAPWLADRRGYLPGRQLKIAGNEARRFIRDWTRTGLSGRYAADGVDVDFDAAMATLDLDVHAVRMVHDWQGPESSLRFLLSRLPRARTTIDVLDDATLGVRADHFGWMQRPERVVDRLLGR